MECANLPESALVLLITSHLAYFALPVMLTALSKALGRQIYLCDVRTAPLGVL